MWSGNLVPGPGFAFIINWDHSLIGGADYMLREEYNLHKMCCTKLSWANGGRTPANRWGPKWEQPFVQWVHPAFALCSVAPKADCQ